MKILALTLLGVVAVAGSAQAQDTCEITEEKVIAAQQSWGEGIEHISQVFMDEGDYEEAAAEHIRAHYAYEDEAPVLFKPTLASDDQFRETFEEALSYFVGGVVEEDKGFAIKPWSAVRWGERGVVINADSALSMGNYFFTPVGSEEETKVEYSFGYITDADCNLKINLHHSSLPYSSE